LASRDERLVENQQTFREANDRFQELASVDPDQRIPFLCECGDLECLGRLEATLSEFEVVHDDPSRYFILPGHVRVEGEEVVTNNGRYEVVTKTASR
jgi:hypothetical protein